MKFNFISKIKNAIQSTIAVTKQKVSNLRETFAKAVQTEATKPTVTSPRNTTNENVSRETKNQASQNTAKRVSKEEVPDIGENDEVIKQYMRDAGDPILSPYDADDVSAFFALTSYIWNKPGIGLDKRLNAIKEFFKAPLADIYDYVVKSEQMEEYLEALYYGEEIIYLNLQFSPAEFQGAQVRG